MRQNREELTLLSSLVYKQTQQVCATHTHPRLRMNNTTGTNIERDKIDEERSARSSVEIKRVFATRMGDLFATQGRSVGDFLGEDAAGTNSEGDSVDASAPSLPAVSICDSSSPSMFFDIFLAERPLLGEDFVAEPLASSAAAFLDLSGFTSFVFATPSDDRDYSSDPLVISA